MSRLDSGRPAREWRSIRGLSLAFFFMVFVSLPANGEEVKKAPAEKSVIKASLNDTTLSKDNTYDLASIINYALKNNPSLRIAGKDVEMGQYDVNIAKANRLLRIDLGGGITRFRYDTYLTPMVVTLPLGSGTEFPVFRRTIWDAGVSFKLPLFRGGRLYRAVTASELRKSISEDILRINRQELVYNLSSVYYKIIQLEKLLVAGDQTIRQLQSHKKNVELFLQSGVAAKLDLLKTDVELSHAEESRLVIKNNLAGAYELLKALMGMDNMNAEISVVSTDTMIDPYPDLEESLKKALSQRPDYRAAAKKKLVGEERVKIAEGKRLPEVFAAGEYTARAGSQTSFKENWNYGVRFSVPLFDGGVMRAEINKEKAELEKVKEEERALRLLINREVRDAYLQISNVRERVQVTGKAIESARENVKVEALKYNTGAGTSTDVIDAQSALLRAETDHYQALFDRETAFAYLKKAVGDDEYDEGVQE